MPYQVNYVFNYLLIITIIFSNKKPSKILTFIKIYIFYDWNALLYINLPICMYVTYVYTVEDACYSVISAMSLYIYDPALLFEFGVILEESCILNVATVHDCRLVYGTWWVAVQICQVSGCLLVNSVPIRYIYNSNLFYLQTIAHKLFHSNLFSHTVAFCHY